MGKCVGKSCGEFVLKKCTGIYLQKVVLKSCGETYDVLDRENVQEKRTGKCVGKSHSYLGQKSVRKKVYGIIT